VRDKDATYDTVFWEPYRYVTRVLFLQSEWLEEMCV